MFNSISFCMLFLLLSASTDVLAGETLVIGRPTKKIDEDYKRLMPIAAYLGARLEAHGVKKGDVLVDGMNSVDGCITLIKEEKLDLLFETPYSALRIIDQTGAKPILTIVRDGAAEYNSYVFARTDSGIAGLADLKGKTVAFEDPGSTSGFYLPYKAMKDAGLDMVQLASSDVAVPEGKTGYVFSQGEVNTASWVYFGKTAAGALSSSDWTKQETCPEAFRSQFTILHQTGKVPRMLVLVRPGLSSGVTEDIKRLLLGMSGDEKGKNALAPFKIEGFSPIEDPGGFVQSLKRALVIE